MSDKFSEFIEKMASLFVPEDNVEEMRERRERVAHEISCALEEVTDEDVIVNADDELLCGETLTLWRLIREARELLKTSGGRPGRLTEKVAQGRDFGQGHPT